MRADGVPVLGCVDFQAKDWATASSIRQGLEVLMKTVAKLGLPVSVPVCYACKSEEVWHKAMDGRYSRICVDCDHIEHLG